MLPKRAQRISLIVAACGLLTVPPARALILISSYTLVNATGSVIAWSIDHDAAGNIYAAGVVNNTAWIGKYSSTLEPLANVTIGGTTGGAWAQKLRIDNAGKIWVVGGTDEGTPSAKAAVWKFDSQLVLLSSAGFPGAFGGELVVFYDLAFASGGQVVAAGWGDLSASNQEDAWVVKLGSSLALVSSATVNGPANNLDAALGLAVDAADNIYVTGELTVAGQGETLWVAEFSPTLTPLRSITRDFAGLAEFGNAVKLDSAGHVWIPEVQNLTIASYQNVPITGDIRVDEFDDQLQLLRSTTVSFAFNHNSWGLDLAFDAQGRAWTVGGLNGTGLQGSGNAWVGVYTSSLTPVADFALQLDTSSIAHGLFIDSTGDAWISANTGAFPNPGEFVVARVGFRPPNPVVDLTASTRASDQISLAWSATGNELGLGALINSTYTVQYTSVASFSSWDPSGAGPNYVAAISISTSGVAPGSPQLGMVHGLSPNTTWYFRLWTTNAFGLNSAVSNPAMACTLAAPPTGTVVAEADSSSVTLAWSSAEDPPGTTYEVQASTSVDFSSVQTSTTVNPAATVAGLSPNTAYFFRVRALSHTAVPTIYDSIVSTRTPLAAPMGLFIAGLTTRGLTLAWTANGNPTGSLYEASFSTSMDFTGNFASTTTTDLSVAFNGLLVNTTYYGRVRVQGLAPSAFVQSGPVSTLADSPTGTSAAGASSTTIALSWTPNGNPAGTLYKVSYWSVGGGTTTTSVAATSFTAAGLSPSTTYYLQVRASNRSGIDSAPDTAISTATASPAQITQVIAPDQGGELTFLLPSGVVDVQVPPGVFAQAVPLTITTPSEPPAGSFMNHVALNVTVSIDASGNQPRGSVRLRIPFSPSDVSGLDVSKLIIARWSDSAQAWVPLPSTVNTSLRYVEAYTNHFSVFRLFQASPPADLSAMAIFPNPLRPALGQTSVTFANLPANARIRIYTMLGELIRDLNADTTGLASWDGTNESGRKTATGVYLALIESGSSRRTAKVAVQR